jgi:hypothetical protein
MFAGLFRTLLYIVAVWFIWRWLDRTFGGRGGRGGRFTDAASPRSSSSGAQRRADDSREGEYVDFEEVKD